MKSAFIAGLATFANAGVVHEFFAETNLICNMCKEVVNHANNNNDEEVDAIYALFPKLSERINAFAGKNELIDLSQPERTCINMNLC
jgi:ABC-type branched-subunit amino acid transport system ATPase component